VPLLLAVTMEGSMKATTKTRTGIVDLGAASAETKGPPIGGPDSFGGQRVTGLSND